MEGRGMTIFPEEHVYQGIFKHGLREGRGSMTFAEGAVYEGRFKEDHFDGQGTLKIESTVPGAAEGEIFLPIAIQADLKRIHFKSGFGPEAPH